MKICHQLTNTKSRNAGLKFEAQANALHNNKYTYTDALYKGARIPIKITCSIHGNFEQRPNDHLNGSGCPTCGVQSISKKVSLSVEDFEARATEVHKGKYKYNQDYTKGSAVVTVICPEHGEFKQLAHNHLSGANCPKCNAALSSLRVKAWNSAKMNTEKFIEASKLRYGNQYSYNSTIYTSWSDPITLTCNLHGEFTINRAGSHLSGLGACKECAKKHTGTGRRRFRGKHTLFYVIQIGELFKIGITTKPILHRYKGNDLPKDAKVVFQTSFLDGEDAFNLELKTKKALKQYGYTGAPIFKYTGTTEIFTVDPLPFIQQQLRKNMEKHFTVQMVKHLNYTAFVEASTQEEAEALAAQNTSGYDWYLMEGLNPTEICTQSGDFIEGEEII